MSGLISDIGQLFGGSSAKTDRGNQLAATQGNWNIFNWALPAGQSQQGTGQNTLATSLNTLQNPIAYWQNLLQGGRTAAAANAQPATQSVIDQANAQRASQGAFGTARQGGTAAANAAQGAATTKSIDDIISQTLQSGQAAGAQGLTSTAQTQAGIGSTQLQNALALLGIGQTSINAILNNATASRPVSQQLNSQAWSTAGNAIGTILSAISGGVSSAGAGGVKGLGSIQGGTFDPSQAAIGFGAY